VLRNGVHEIRLHAEDSAGNVVSAEVFPVIVDGGLSVIGSIGVGSIGSGRISHLILNEIAAYFEFKSGLYRSFWGQKGRYKKKRERNPIMLPKRAI